MDRHPDNWGGRGVQRQCGLGSALELFTDAALGFEVGKQGRWKGELETVRTSPVVQPGAGHVFPSGMVGHPNNRDVK